MDPKGYRSHAKDHLSSSNDISPEDIAHPPYKDERTDDNNYVLH